MELLHAISPSTSVLLSFNMRIKTYIIAGSVDEDGQASFGSAVEMVVQYGGEWSRARGRGIYKAMSASKKP